MRKRRFGKTDLIWLILAVLAASAICFFKMDGFRLNWNGMTSFGADGILGMALNKSVQEYGLKGFFFNARIGAPDISALIDTPFQDPAYGFLVFILSWLPSPAAIEYGIILVTFAASAFTMFLVVRVFTNDHLLMFIFAVLGSVTPYHMMRGIGHMTLSHYWNVPLGVLLALYIALMHDRRFDPKDKKMYLLAVLVGLGNVYYSFFCLLIMMVGEVCQFIAVRNRHNLLKGLRLILVTILTFFAGIAPKIWYGHVAGENIVAGIRYPIETEMYGMKLSQLLLPPAYSLWGRITQVYNILFDVTENRLSSLGIVAVIGFCVLVIWLLIRVISPGLENQIKQRNQDNQSSQGNHGFTQSSSGAALSILAVFALGLVVWCTIGGFSSLFSMVFSPEIRATNRASILIVIICLLALVILLDRVLRHPPAWLRRGAVYGITLVLMVVGIFEACHGIRLALYSDGMQNLHEELKAFYEKVEDSLPKEAMVYQLPFVLFPESLAVNEMQDYTQMEGYLYTDSLRWSYGGMKGRNLAARDLYAGDGQSKTFVRNILEAGFNGVVVYSEAYADGAEGIRSFYEQTLGLTPVCSESNHRIFYDISSLNPDELVEDYTAGEKLTFCGANPNALPYVCTGLTTIEHDFSWTEGHLFAMRMRVVGEDSEDAEASKASETMHARFHIRGIFGDHQNVLINVDGETVCEAVIEDVEQDIEFDFKLPEDGVVEIAFELPDAIAPIVVDQNMNDTRVIALQMVNFVIEQS